MRFTVLTLDRDRAYGHHCFDDVARALREALTLAGHEVVALGEPYARYIVFGATNGHARGLPDDTILFNCEQLAVTQTLPNLEFFRSHVVWDYSRANIAWLRAQGCSRVALCPIGYVPTMECVHNWPEPDVDVLFYGAVNDRRREVIEAIDRAGLRSKNLHAYGKERDLWIGRSKVVLNVHYYEKAVFEVVRCSHLYANRKCVVSEQGGLDPELEAMADSLGVHVPHGQIVETCVRLCRGDARGYQAVADRGYDGFRQRPGLVESVRAAVEASV